MNIDTGYKPMKLAKLLSVTALGLTSFAEQSFASEHPGKALHEDANCMKCHAAKPYDPNKSDSYPKLVKAVAFCNNNLNAGMFDDEVEQLADYLNETYYHHKK
ncbi:MAG: hypothetical protein R3254_02320 [Thiomicrorhabdus sp.]|nr:hypothetical protein [Thiomicrorhabdus sp.]